MKICLEQVGKRFQRHWIFKDISRTFTAPNRYALLGPNGSGKSTLMRIIGSIQVFRPGRIRYFLDDKPVAADKLYPFISYCAPGMELIEEMTLSEFLSFHFSFKKLLPGTDIRGILEMTGLKQVANRPIGDYSSGMKQRVKLAQALFADTPLLLLDEPCTNLDDAGVRQYREWIDRYTAGRLVIIASNDPREYDFCEEQILLTPSR